MKENLKAIKQVPRHAFSTSFPSINFNKIAFIFFAIMLNALCYHPCKIFKLHYFQHMY